VQHGAGEIEYAIAEATMASALGAAICPEAAAPRTSSTERRSALTIDGRPKRSMASTARGVFSISSMDGIRLNAGPGSRTAAS